MLFGYLQQDNYKSKFVERRLSTRLQFALFRFLSPKFPKPLSPLASTLKRLRVNLTHYLWFLNASSKKMVKPCFFFYFYFIHIFPENFIAIPQVVQKIWRISLSILVIFINFHRFFVIASYLFVVLSIVRNIDRTMVFSKKNNFSNLKFAIRKRFAQSQE